MTLLPFFASGECQSLLGECQLQSHEQFNCQEITQHSTVALGPRIRTPSKTCFLRLLAFGDCATVGPATALGNSLIASATNSIT
jgi:hypothetical protein